MDLIFILVKNIKQMLLTVNSVEKLPATSLCWTCQMRASLCCIRSLDFKFKVYHFSLGWPVNKCKCPVVFRSCFTKLKVVMLQLVGELCCLISLDFVETGLTHLLDLGENMNEINAKHLGINSGFKAKELVC